MSPNVQRIAIAEACGWKRLGEWIEGIGCMWLGVDDLYHADCPDYLTDLNAMHEAEKVLTWDQRQEYIGWICTEGEFATVEEYHWFVCKATAAQRAEALLRTLNLWDDSR